jgi:ribose transport system ATP-binding protein
MKENKGNISLSMDGICKKYNNVKAIDNVKFELKYGEVHALLGENGAGKSTLIKILSGAIQADKGKISIDGKIVKIRSPKEASDNGVGTIYQELMLVPHLSVVENIFLGREPLKKIKRVDWKLLKRKAKKLLDELDIKIDPQALVMDLPVAQRQLIEIAKAFSQNPKILVMDEPTSALTESEIDLLLKRISHLKEKGIGIIYISHKMEEISQIADRVTVLRDGEYIGTLEKDEIDISLIIEMMVGRKGILDFHRKKQLEINDPIFEVEGISTEVLKDISFKLNRGELLGIAGLMGSGRTEMARAIFGIDDINNGSLIFNKKKIKINHPQKAVKLGIGFAPEDRKDEALFLDMNVATNISISQVCKKRRIFRDIGYEKNLGKEYIKKLGIRTQGVLQEVKVLSGGNQQKVVVSRWLATNPKILILDEPTRGIDVGAKIEIYEILTKLAKEGMSIIIISSEMEELLAVADRILVMCEGQIRGEVSAEEASQKLIMSYATGHFTGGSRNGKNK